MDTIHRDGLTVVRLIGELDIASAPQLERYLEQLIDEDSCRLVVDLSDLTFCDSTGLARFVAAASACVRSGGWLRLAGPQPQLARVLGITGLLAAVATYRSVAAATDQDDDQRITT
jgi:anti-anti-sigma factor